MSAGTVPPPTRAPDADTRGALERCTGDAEAFLLETWGRRAAIHAGADPLGFADLLTFDDVDRLLTTTSLRAPAFRLVKAGETIREASYTRSGTTGSRPVAGLPDPARIATLFHDGATIVLQGVHRYHEPVARLIRDLELELGHPCQVNAYITPPGAQGLALHEDAHDVFTLQAFGRKRWEIHGAPREPERPPLDAIVEPGDCLYLPAGTPHAATTQDELSGHLTIGVHVTSWREVVRTAIDAALAGAGALDEPLPAGWHEDPDALARELAARLRSAAISIENADAEAIAQTRIDRFLTRRPPLLRGIVAAQLAADAIDGATPVRRRPGAVCRVHDGASGSSDPAEITLLLGDRRLEMPAWLRPAIDHITRVDGAFTADDLAGEIPDPSSRLVLVRRLVREGLLVLPDPAAEARRPRG